jgi:hypothetical protein
MKIGKSHSSILCAIALGLSSWIATSNGATVTVTTVDNGVSNIGAVGTLYWAITNASPGDTIAFNVPGAGPHHFLPPPKGFPLVYQKHGLTIDGYTQPGSVSNTAAITATNNALLKIVIDCSNGNARDMAYVFYGKYPLVTDSDPPIDNTAMFGDGTKTATGREQGGYDPDAFDIADPNPPSTYAVGEKAALGVYRSRNVTIKGLAFIGTGSGNGIYLLAFAQDFGLDTAIKERYTYDNGTCRGAHVAGCWFGVDPVTGLDAGSKAGITAYRHRDRSGLAATVRRPLAATDPDGEGIPNLEGGVIGVAPGSSNPRAEFNVFGADLIGNGSLGLEPCRFRISGNQIMTGTDIGRYSDTQVPAVIIGTDGDGVNDAEEGNLFVSTLGLYSTRSKVFAIAGNVFGLNRDGTRVGAAAGDFTVVDSFAFDQGTICRFGSDFDGTSDALEGNKVYNGRFAVNVGGGAPSNGSAFSMRRNQLVNCLTPPIDGSQLTYFNKFMDASVTAKPVISATSTTSTLVGTCSVSRPPYSRILFDLYVSDPEGDTASDPQGKTYLGTFEDNSGADSNATPGAFSFNISSLGIAPGTKVTLAANYRAAGAPTIASISVSGGNATLGITNGLPTYGILSASDVSGPYSLISLAKLPGNVTVPAAGNQGFFRVTGLASVEQTSPFADSVTLP